LITKYVLPPDQQSGSDTVDVGSNVSLLANLLTQYPGVGQEILSNIGQNIMSHLRTQAGQEPEVQTPFITEHFSDDEEEDIYEGETESLETHARNRLNQNITASDVQDDFEMISDEEVTDDDQ